VFEKGDAEYDMNVQERTRMREQTEQLRQTQDAEQTTLRPALSFEEGQRQTRLSTFAGMREAIPLRSAQLKEELKQGPSKALSKSERKEWQTKKKAELRRVLSEEAALAERRRIFEPAFEMMDRTEAAVTEWRAGHAEESDGFSPEFAETLSRSFSLKKALNPGSLIDSGAPPESVELANMLKTLLAASPANFTAETAKEMSARYKALPVPLASVVSQLDGGNADQPQADYFFLLHGVALALQNHVNGQAPESVNREQLAALYAVTSASGLAAGVVMSDPSYRKRRAQVAVEADTALKAAARRQEKEDYIRTGRSVKDGLREDWALAPFYEEVWALLERDYPSLCKDDTSSDQMNELSRVLERYNNRLRKNTEACKLFLQKKRDENPLLFIESFAAEMQERLLGALKEKLLTQEFHPSYDDNVVFAYGRLLESSSISEKTARYQARLDRLCDGEDRDMSALRPHIQTAAAAQSALLDLNDEDFASYAELFRRLVKNNLKIMDAVFAENIFLPNEAVKKLYMTRYGAGLLYGAPEAIRAQVSYFAKNLWDFAPEFAQEADTLLRVARKQFFPIKWCAFLERDISYLPIEDRRDEAVLTGLMKLRLPVLRRNERKLDEIFHGSGMFSPAQWGKLKEDCSHFLLIEDENQFSDQVNNFLSSILREQSQRAGRAPVSYADYNMNLLRGEIRERKSAARTSHFADQIRGADLYAWAGFGNYFNNHLDALIESLDLLLREGKLNTIPGAEKIRSMADMDFKFSQAEFDRFLTGLRENVLLNLPKWRDCGPLRDRLLPALLLGLSKNEFLLEIQMRQAELANEEKTNKLRFEMRLLDEKQEAEAVRYSYLNSTMSTALRKNDSRPVRRLARFNKAAALRRALNEAGLLEDAMTRYRALLEAHKQKTPTAKDFQKSLEPLFKGKAETSLLAEARSLLKDDGDYVLEFGISGYEDVILNDDERREALTSKGRSIYEGKLAGMPQRIDSRLRELDALFKEYADSSFAARRETVLANMRELIVNLPEEREGFLLNAEDARQNAARYGAETWQGAVLKLKTLLLTGMSEEKRAALNFSEAEYAERAGVLREAQSVVNLRQRRLADLRGLEEGLFAEILPYLTRREEDARILSIGSDKEFQSYSEQLQARLTAPLKILKNHYLPFYRQQLYMEYGAKLADPKGTADVDWRSAFDEHVRRIDTLNLGGRSIGDWIRELNNADVGAYATELLLNDADLFSGGFKAAEEKIKQAGTKIKENLKELNEFISAHTGGDALSAAREEGFRQFLRHEIATMNKEAFKEILDTRLRNFLRAEARDRVQVEKSETIMQERALHAQGIDAVKLEGYKAWLKANEGFSSLKQKLYGGLSPAALRLAGEKAVSPAEARIAEARRSVEEHYEDYDADVKNILAERVLFTPFTKKTEKTEEEERASRASLQSGVGTALNALAKRLKKEGGEATSFDLPGIGIPAFLQYVSLFGTPERSGEGKFEYPDARINALYEDFAGKLEVLRRLRELPRGDAILTREHDEAIRVLSYGMYGLDTGAFYALAEKRIEYFKRSAELCELIGAALSNFEIPDYERASLTLGLREYFHARILDAAPPNAEAIREETRLLLEDKQKRQFVAAGKPVRKRAAASKKRRSGVTGVDYLSAEFTSYLLTGREDLQGFLKANSKDPSLVGKIAMSAPEILDLDTEEYKGPWRRYNALTPDQQRIFASVLSVPGALRETDDSAGMALVYGEVDRRAARRDLRLRIEAYINHESFDPQIDYAIVLGQLRDANGALDEAIFEAAMRFTLLCVEQRRRKGKIDRERLADPMESIIYKHGEKRALELSNTPIHNREDLMDALLVANDRTRSKWFNQLDELDDVAFSLLVHALQDRSAIDRSTTVSAWAEAGGTIHVFADEEKRTDIRERYLHNKLDFAAVSPDLLQRAFLTLHSYQLRDDEKLTRSRLHTADFASEALERETAVDWPLLDRALRFVNETEDESVRLRAIQRAPNMIEDSGNEPARKLYGDEKSNIGSLYDLEAFLLRQAGADGQMPALAGYFSLEPTEKNLVIKALSRRDLLDVSKKDIMLNRFGFMERDYANPRARDALIDQYVNNPASITLQEDDVLSAFRGCLSSQIDDSASRERLRSAFRTDIDGNYSRKKIFGSSRKTAVDWKLFSRALQLARRAQNEKDVFFQERELYRSQGNPAESGAFRYNAHFMRKNVHNAGYRIVRHLGRRALSYVPGGLPGQVARLLLPTELNDRLSRMPAFRPDVPEADVLNYTDTVSGIVSAFIGVSTIGGDIAKNIAGYIATSVSGVSDVRDAIRSVREKARLNEAREEGEDALREDERQMSAAERDQSEAERDLARRASERNAVSVEIGLDKADQRMNDALIYALASTASDASRIALRATGLASLNLALDIALKEASEFVNFLRVYFNDKKSVEQYFQKDAADLTAYREKMKSLLSNNGNAADEKAKEQIDKMSLSDLACGAMGFENQSELASYVGLNVTRSLLFCAGDQNPQKNTRVRALATLTVLRCGDCIGKLDDETALRVYSMIMGERYR
jgi:hypothetical protein